MRDNNMFVLQLLYHRCKFVDLHMFAVLGSFGVKPRLSGNADYTRLSEDTRNFGIIETTPKALTLTTYRQDGSMIEVIQITKPANRILLVSLAILALLAIGSLVLLKRRCKST